MAGPVPLVTPLLVASHMDSWDPAQQKSGVRGTSSDSQARDHFISHFQGKIWQVQDLPPHQGFPCEAELNSSNL